MANKDFYYQKENVDGDIEYKKINLGTEGKLLSVTSEGDIGLVDEPAGDNVYQLQPGRNNSIYPVNGNNIMNSASNAGTISGGLSNCILTTGGSVGGGSSNCSGCYGVVGGGICNKACGAYNVISGGHCNCTFNTNCHCCKYMTVGGGSFNKVCNNGSTVAGGIYNTTNGQYSSIAGGTTNCIIGNNSTISGGTTNCVTVGTSSIGGGSLNKVSGGGGTIGGGSSNNVIGSNGTIGGGSLNTVAGGYDTIGGGLSNVANGYGATVSGGGQNNTYGMYSVISGGFQNNIYPVLAEYTNITGGLCNQIEAFSTGSSILGGSENKVGTISLYGTILGGLQNTIDPEVSFGMASGWGAKVTNQGEESRSVGFFSDFGDAQVSNFILRSKIDEGSTFTFLRIHNQFATPRVLSIPNNVTWNYEIDVVGRREDDITVAGYKFKGVIDSSDVETTLVSKIKETLYEDDVNWDCDISISDNGGASELQIVCRDEDVNITTRWVAQVRVVQVGVFSSNYGSCCCC